MTEGPLKAILRGQRSEVRGAGADSSPKGEKPSPARKGAAN